MAQIMQLPEEQKAEMMEMHMEGDKKKGGKDMDDKMDMFSLFSF